MGLDVDARDNVDEEEGTIVEMGDSGDLAAKVNVVGGVDEVHLVASRH